MSAYQDGVATIPVSVPTPAAPSEPLGPLAIGGLLLGGSIIVGAVQGVFRGMRAARRRAPRFYDQFGRTL